MTQASHQPASAGHTGGLIALPNAAPDGEDLATRAARTRQTNAHRATYAAEALHRHGQISHSDADDMQQALVELLTDLHHLCDACDLDLAPLYEAAGLIHTRETQAA
ncbi:hypothetical protein ACFQ46_02250 [Kineococcus sp. GCM10028916]|uniref:hypothetical protein n=1 Tax=Kineococcus sp. GCM10028916 TaxID=3273394 RepID=UPI0036382FFD